MSLNLFMLSHLNTERKVSPSPNLCRHDDTSAVREQDCWTYLARSWCIPCQSGWRRPPVLHPQVYTGWRVHYRSSFLGPPCYTERSNICSEGSCVFDSAACHRVWTDEWSSPECWSEWSDLRKNRFNAVSVCYINMMQVNDVAQTWTFEHTWL